MKHLLTGAFALYLAISDIFTGANATTLKLPGGRLVGEDMADGSTIFNGIPYAESPAGDNRWRPPVPRKPWRNTLDTRNPAPNCIQPDFGWNREFLANTSEDCLTLSIRTPTSVRSGDSRTLPLLPVLVFIHGGANAVGGAGRLDTDSLQRQGIVVVRVQYRLGVFGFLSLDQLNRESGTSGNYALLDQLLALQWVRDNIAAFGGDPERVTIAGNSSGALDALFLTLSPRAKGLFRGAILQAPAPGPAITSKESVDIGQALMARLKLEDTAKDLKRLRQTSVDQILAAADGLPVPKGVDPSFLWEMQVLDGQVQKQGYAEATDQKAEKDVAIIIGSNIRELGADRPNSAGITLIRSAFGDTAEQALKLYGYQHDQPPGPDPLYGSIPTQVITDMWFRCPAIQLSRYLSRANQGKTWRYEFGLGHPGSGKPPEHTSEMGYIYPAIPTDAKATDWPPMQRYWVNFIRTGDPNGPGVPLWRAVASADWQLSVLADGIVLQSAPRTAICDLQLPDGSNPRAPRAAGP